MKVLLVEDDARLVLALTEGLLDEHYTVEVAEDGQLAWDLLTSYEFDLVLLDVMLPKLDGISLCRQLRAAGKQTPILLLTARDTTADKVQGLDAGADDYVVKPFELEELLARARALLRRGGPTMPPVLSWGEISLDPSTCEAKYGSVPLALTPKEYALLELLLRHQRQVLSRGAILNHLWPYAEGPDEDAVKAHVKGLRHKLREAGGEGDLIETVYGLGYRLRE